MTSPDGSHSKPVADLPEGAAKLLPLHHKRGKRIAALAI